MLNNDNIKVFISSTIGECADERRHIKSAIKSLKHTPIAFENLGARSHPPRDTYIRGIEESHIIVAVYKDNYGWIAPEMEISGLEDEYIIFRKSLQKHSLIYIYKDDSNRDPKLQEIIDDAMNSGVIVHFYENAPQLEAQVRNDLTTLISEKFIAAISEEFKLEGSSASYLEESLAGLQGSVHRGYLEKKIEEISKGTRIINFHGPLGSGKSVLIAQYANKNNAKIINCRNIDKSGTARKVILSLSPHSYLATNEDWVSLLEKLVEACKANPETTIILDEADNPYWLSDTLNLQSSAGHQLPLFILVTRKTISDFPGKTVKAQPLSEEESVQLVKIANPNIDRHEAIEAFRLSQGNPLYLRYFARAGGLKEESIKGFEVQAWRTASDLTRQILTYLALANSPLSINILQKILEDSGEKPPEVLNCIDESNHLIRVTDNKVSLFHPHLALTINEQLLQKPLNRNWHASKLGKILSDESMYMHAFILLAESNIDEAIKIAGKASTQSVFLGEIQLAISITLKRIDLIEKPQDAEQKAILYLGLSDLYQLNGQYELAKSSLQKARLISKSNDDSLETLIQEREVSINAFSDSDNKSLQKLTDMRNHSILDEDFERSGRLSIEISSLHLRNGNHENGCKEAIKAFRFFDRCENSYGTTISRLNIISALSGVSRRQKCAEKLSLNWGINERSKRNERFEAMLCNIQCREERRSGSPHKAIISARRAIEIATRIGDKHLIAINQINLANAYKDLNESDQSLAHYMLASKIAFESNFRALQANANELISNLHNKHDRHELAINHAQMAASLSLECNANSIYASAKEEMAVANLGTGNYLEAAKNLIDGGRRCYKDEDCKEIAPDMLYEGQGIYIEKGMLKPYLESFDFFIHHSNSEDIIFRTNTLISALPELAKYLRDDDIIRFLSRHISLVFKDLPFFMVNNVFDTISTTLTHSIKEKNEDKSLSKSSVSAIISLLISSPLNDIGINSLVSLAEKVFSSSNKISFSANPDGSACWNLNLNTSPPLIVSIVQLDDRQDSFSISMLLALLLSGLEITIFNSIIRTTKIKKTELLINVCEINELINNIPEAATIIGELELHSAVTRPTDVKSEEMTPTLVVFNEAISDNWGTSPPGDNQELACLLTQFLTEFTYQILEGEVDIKLLTKRCLSVLSGLSII